MSPSTHRWIEQTGHYSAGAGESRTQPVDDGVQAMLALLAGADQQAETLCETLLDSLAGAAGDDDVALLYAQLR